MNECVMDKTIVELHFVSAADRLPEYNYAKEFFVVVDTKQETPTMRMARFVSEDVAMSQNGGCALGGGPGPRGWVDFGSYDRQVKGVTYWAEVPIGTIIEKEIKEEMNQKLRAAKEELYGTVECTCCGSHNARWITITDPTPRFPGYRCPGVYLGCPDCCSRFGGMHEYRPLEPMVLVPRSWVDEATGIMKLTKYLEE